MTDLVKLSSALNESGSDNLPIGVEFEVKPLFGGTQVLVRFPNGFGASVVRHIGSYGGRCGLWELAPIQWGGDNGTDKTWDFIGIDMQLPGFECDDVKGSLIEQDVDELLEMISKL